MAEGFTLLDAEIGLADGELWDVVQVSFGRRANWCLEIELERDGQSQWIRFSDPVSHRVQDEREICSYWTTRASEGIAIGTFYAVARSEYLDEIGSGVSGLHDRLHHYLVVGVNVCVEVIDLAAPDQLLASERLSLGEPSPA